MTWAILAWRNLMVRPGRAALLLLGYALGVAVMIVLLSVGDAMLDQSRDVSLVGGGDLTALPHGIDREALRSGGLTGMFYGIPAAHFVTRQLLGGPRFTPLVRSVSPALEQKRLTLAAGDSNWTVRAGGDLPAAAAAAGNGLAVTSGAWGTDATDQAWATPSAQQLYDEIDHFHRPQGHDSTWAEWQYANVVVSDREWWYITLMVAGDVNGGHSGGQVLVTHRLPNGQYHRFVESVPRSAVTFDTLHADIAVGPGRVTQRDGIYHFEGHAGAARFDFQLTPAPHRYFPPVDLGASTQSGYAVAALRGTATGELCDGGACTRILAGDAYHDHNWGTWRAVTWEWGAGRGRSIDLLYGGVLGPTAAAGDVPFLLAIEDSLGLRQLYRFRGIQRFGRRSIAGMSGVVAADSFLIVASRDADSVRLMVKVADVAVSTSRAAGPDRVFLQMRGAWRLVGRAVGAPVADSGQGFFETWATRPRAADR
ncbi:MAG TPA: hypothetical protein VGM77_02240 [Gemmatimonadales bacterium]